MRAWLCASGGAGLVLAGAGEAAARLGAFCHGRGEFLREEGEADGLGCGRRGGAEGKEGGWLGRAFVYGVGGLEQLHRYYRISRSNSALQPHYVYTSLLAAGFIL